MSSLYVSVMPTWQCGLNCSYCYLGDLRQDKAILDLDILANVLQSVSRYELTICCYGGEISLLGKEYTTSLINVCKKFSSNISIQSNLQNPQIVEWCDDLEVNLSVSLNKERANNKFVESFIKGKRFDVTTVVLKSVLDTDPVDLLAYYEQLGVKTVSFLPYSKSKYNDLKISMSDYDNYMLRVILEYKKGNYSFAIDNLNWGKYKSTADTSIFISPTGEKLTVKFDENGCEYFEAINCSLSLLRYNELMTNAECLACPYYSTRCLADHIRPDCCAGHKLWFPHI